MGRHRLAYPPNQKLAQQAIHWARLTAQENEQNITIIILPDQYGIKMKPHTSQYIKTHMS
jgi:hypothetical protein